MPALVGASAIMLSWAGGNAVAGPGKVLEPGDQAAAIAQVFDKAVPRLHLSHQPLDVTVATNALNIYLTMLDYDRTVFMAGDIAEFSREAPLLSDRLAKGDTAFAFRVFERFKERLRDRADYVDALLAKGFDVTAQESFVWKRKDLPWAATEAEWNELWRKKVKNEYVARLVARQMAEEARTQGVQQAEPPGAASTNREAKAAGEERASAADALLSPENFIRKRYKQYLLVIEDSDAEFVMQRYFSAFTQAYDPHSEYMTPSTSEDFEIAMKLSLGGIGALLQSEDGAAKIEQIIPGGPAARDGRLKPGDRIIAVAQEGQPPVDILHWPLYKAVGLIRGEKGTKVTLTVIPASDISGSRAVKLELTRDEVKLEEQEAKGETRALAGADGLTHTIGIIRLPAFYADMKNRIGGRREYKSCVRDVAKLLRDMIAGGAQGIVLDLRDNGGGSLPEAVELTGLFLPAGPVVQVRESRGVQVLSDPDPDVLYRGPLVVLVNRRSASASEILAAALQDYGRAVIVGDGKTHGKGTVQSWQPLNEDSAALGTLKITTHSFYRVAGGSTQLRGVVPDIVIPSVLDVMDVGEEFLPHAMRWSVINMARYRPVASMDAVIPALAAKSSTRREQDPRFAAQRDLMERLKRHLASAEISLNLADRLALAREEKGLDKAQQEALAEDESADGAGKRDQDLILRETENILADLIELKRGKDGKREHSILENAWGRQ
jgi:carboxyl-terminal processing protease